MVMVSSILMSSVSDTCLRCRRCHHHSRINKVYHFHSHHIYHHHIKQQHSHHHTILTNPLLTPFNHQHHIIFTTTSHHHLRHSITTLNPNNNITSLPLVYMSHLVCLCRNTTSIHLQFRVPRGLLPIPLLSTHTCLPLTTTTRCLTSFNSNTIITRPNQKLILQNLSWQVCLLMTTVAARTITSINTLQQLHLGRANLKIMASIVTAMIDHHHHHPMLIIIIKRITTRSNNTKDSMTMVSHMMNLHRHMKAIIRNRHKILRRRMMIVSRTNNKILEGMRTAIRSSDKLTMNQILICNRSLTMKEIMKIGSISMNNSGVMRLVKDALT